MKALPKVPFSTPFDAFEHGNMCTQPTFGEGMLPQFDYKYSEDCLFLNIYAPHSRDKDNKLPVMVWIYGGGFNFGFADLYLGDNIAAYGDVILVTLNYRLSLWGFLSTGSDVAPGNAGLWDQHMAIKWVHDNIGAFGGDNERVTIFGESAGSASVIYQALYPGNKGLIQRVIGQSGSVESYWASQREVPKYTRKLASITDCENDDSKAMVECLQNVSNDQFVEIVTNVSYGLFFLPFPFNPTRDNDFVRYDPRAAFADLPSDVIDMFRSVDLMTGVNSAEGNLGVGPFFGINDPESFLPSREEYENVYLSKFIYNLFQGYNNVQELKDLVIAEYTNWNNPDNPYDIRLEYVEMNGDGAFLGALYNTIDNHAQESTANTFMYLFDVIPATPLITNITWLKGLPHAEELPLVFGHKSDFVEDGSVGVQWEQLLSKDVITLWTNFAKTGNPNKPVNLGLDWLPYTEEHQHYLHITRDMTSLNVKQRWNTRRANFWSKIVPKIANGEMCSNKDKEAGKGDEGTCEKDGGCTP